MNASSLAILLLGVLLFRGPAQPDTTTKTYELRGGAWWTGTAFEPRRMYSANGVFASERPANVDSVIDLEGHYIVPPFGESHTHTIAWSKSRIGEFMRDGVFYALVMNVDRTSIGENFTWFNRQGTVDVNFTTAGVTASDGHPVQIGLRFMESTVDEFDGDWITIVETQEDLDSKWSALAEGNPDLIKIFLVYSDRYQERHADTMIAMRYKGMDPELVAPLVRKAHAAGLRVAAHVRTAHDFGVAVQAGVDVVAHLPGFSMGPESTSDLDNPERVAEIEHPEWFRIHQADAALAGANDVTVIPTIGSFSHVIENARAIRNGVIADNLRMLRHHGVRIAVGSDEGEGSPVTEALLMHRLNVFTEAELLQMLTENAARVIFPRRSVGRLADGYEASFLALGGDPTKEFERIRDVRLRFKQGAPVILP